MTVENEERRYKKKHQRTVLVGLFKESIKESFMVRRNVDHLTFQKNDCLITASSASTFQTSCIESLQGGASYRKNPKVVLQIRCIA